MYCKFLPVTGNFRRENMHYFRDSKYFYYPYIFVSPFVTGFYCTKKSFPDAKLIIADSGGYQIKTKRKDEVNWHRVLQFQERIADIGLTLDIPPLTKINQREIEYDKTIFDKCLEQSRFNANNMIEYKTNPNMKTYAVIQGISYDDATKWYNCITKDHEFDGYALPIALIKKKEGIQRFIEQIKFVKELGSDFHFLGNCSQIYMLVYARLAQNIKKRFTFDSSTASNALRYGVYYDPIFHLPIHLSKNKENRVRFDMDGSPPCDCPICQKHTLRQFVANPFLTYLHNVYTIKNFNEYVSVMTQDDNEFRCLLQRLVGANQIYRNISDDFIKQILSIL